MCLTHFFGWIWRFRVIKEYGISASPPQTVFARPSTTSRCLTCPLSIMSVPIYLLNCMKWVTLWLTISVVTPPNHLSRFRQKTIVKAGDVCRAGGVDGSWYGKSLPALNSQSFLAKTPKEKKKSVTKSRLFRQIVSFLFWLEKTKEKLLL